MDERIEAMKQRIAQVNAETESLKELWLSVLPADWLPKDFQFKTWLRQADYYVVIYGIESTADRYNRKDQEAAEDDKPMEWNQHAAIRFVSGCIQQQKRRDEAEERKYAAMNGKGFQREEAE